MVNRSHFWSSHTSDEVSLKMYSDQYQWKTGYVQTKEDREGKGKNKNTTTLQILNIKYTTLWLAYGSYWEKKTPKILKIKYRKLPLQGQEERRQRINNQSTTNFLCPNLTCCYNAHANIFIFPIKMWHIHNWYFPVTATKMCWFHSKKIKPSYQIVNLTLETTIVSTVNTWSSPPCPVSSPLRPVMDITEVVSMNAAIFSGIMLCSLTDRHLCIKLHTIIFHKPKVYYTCNTFASVGRNSS